MYQSQPPIRHSATAPSSAPSSPSKTSRIPIMRRGSRLGDVTNNSTSPVTVREDGSALHQRSPAASSVSPKKSGTKFYNQGSLHERRPPPRRPPTPKTTSISGQAVLSVKRRGGGKIAGEGLGRDESAPVYSSLEEMLRSQGFAATRIITPERGTLQQLRQAENGPSGRKAAWNTCPAGSPGTLTRPRQKQRGTLSGLLDVWLNPSAEVDGKSAMRGGRANRPDGLQASRQAVHPLLASHLLQEGDEEPSPSVIRGAQPRTSRLRHACSESALRGQRTVQLAARHPSTSCIPEEPRLYRTKSQHTLRAKPASPIVSTERVVLTPAVPSYPPGDYYIDSIFVRPSGSMELARPSSQQIGNFFDFPLNARSCLTDILIRPDSPSPPHAPAQYTSAPIILVQQHED